MSASIATTVAPRWAPSRWATKRLNIAVEAGLITDAEANAAWRSEVRDVAS